MNTFAALAMASATVALPPGVASSAMFGVSSQITHPMYVGGAYGNYGSGSMSRPDHLAGEASVSRRIVNFSAGSFAVGDFATINPRPQARAIEDVMIGAALMLQSVQSPMERDIQEIVSAKFESYWD